ncbi:MAG TPA: SUMF1/EgtB/PvdO family nonheme iron enzyme [Bryobacteraceae bacterium]
MIHSYGPRLKLALGLLLSAGYLGAQSNSKIDFQRDIEPIFEKYCLQCHSSAAGNNHLAIASRQGLIDRKALVPGQPGASPLYTTVRDGSMPPGGQHLTQPEITALGRWIEEGAPWPDNVTLTAAPKQAAAKPAPAKPASPAKAAEMDNVRQIRERILSHQRESSNQNAKTYSVKIPNTTVGYDMALVPAGDFLMGSPDYDPQHKKDEQPPHKVQVGSFWMQTHEVTWDEYRLFMFAHQSGENTHKDQVVDGVSRPTHPYVEMSFGMGINGFPAISMTQHAANKYAEWLSAKTGEFYRLPTEAEWEYACRAGSTTPYYFGSDASKLADYAWYKTNSGGKYQKVGTKKPNAWGLYDMLGNVMEWTLDQYAPYHAGPETKPWVKPTEPYPIAVRGGSWDDPADMLRCAARVGSDPSWKQQDPQLPKSIWYETDAQWLGFRLIRPAQVPSAEEMYAYWNNGVEHDEQ